MIKCLDAKSSGDLCPMTGLLFKVGMIMMADIFSKEQVAPGCEEFNLQGPYGTLYGIINKCRRQENAGKVLVIAHGFRGSLEGGGRATRLAAAAADFCQVVRFNFSECQLLSKQVQELECVLKFIQARLAPHKLCLLGRSLGGATAILVAGRHQQGAKPRVDGLALWSTPSDLPATFNNVLGPDNFQKLSGGQDLWLEDERGQVLIQAAFVQEIQQYDLPSVLRHWQGKPLLILHGTEDKIVAPEQAQKNFAAAGNPKQLVYIPGGDHSFTVQGEAAAATVLQWLRSWF